MGWRDDGYTLLYCLSRKAGSFIRTFRSWGFNIYCQVRRIKGACQEQLSQQRSPPPPPLLRVCKVLYTLKPFPYPLPHYILPQPPNAYNGNHPPPPRPLLLHPPRPPPIPNPRVLLLRPPCPLPPFPSSYSLPPQDRSCSSSCASRSRQWRAQGCEWYGEGRC